MKMDREQATQLRNILSCEFRIILANPQGMNEEMLIVLDHTRGGEKKLSIAFDLGFGAKCWTTEKKDPTFPVQEQGDKPRYHPDYKTFCYKGRRFFPYSIQSRNIHDFNNVESFRTLCDQIHWHMYGQ